MSDLEVRIVTLEPMRVASFHGFGASPETLAWNKLIKWAKPKGLLADQTKHRIFGFNNPNPSSGSPNYGYEFWISVQSDLEEEGEAKFKEVSGGMYAVTRCKGAQNITATWKKLVEYLADSHYNSANHQWLEEHIDQATAPIDSDELVLDLFAPIAE